MSLELFMTTIKEYNRVARQLPFEINKSLTDSQDEATYVAVQIRLMLLRKYVSKSSNNNVYFENLIKEAKDRFVQESDCFEDLQNRFLDINKGSFEQIHSDGTKLNLYESIEDIMYGLYLHADSDRILRLSLTREAFGFYCAKTYVENIEPIILELFRVLDILNVPSITEKKHEKAPVIYTGELNSQPQEIKASPYWGNMHGKDATNDEVFSLVNEQSIEELQILSKALLFLEELKKDKVSLDVMKNLVLKSRMKDWGDFSQAIEIVNKIPNIGASQKVRFDEKRNTACVYLLPQVNAGFVVNSPHTIANEDMYGIVFKKNISNDWRIYALNVKIDINT